MDAFAPASSAVRSLSLLHADVDLDSAQQAEFHFSQEFGCDEGDILSALDNGEVLKALQQQQHQTAGARALSVVACVCLSLCLLLFSVIETHNKPFQLVSRQNFFGASAAGGTWAR